LKEHELVGEERFESLLTGFSKAKRGRGRPEDIADEKLLRNLADLNFVLEQSWGLIGWHLSKAKAIVDIRSALNRITEFEYPALDVFRRVDTKAATTKSLRKLQRDLSGVLCQCRTDYEARESAREIYENALGATAVKSDQKIRKQILPILPKLSAEFENAKEKHKSSQLLANDLASQLDGRRAVYAQTELLRFIRSGRYAFTPLSLAKGMAGLPYISARVSSQRCALLSQIPRPGLYFRIFQMIESVFSTPIPALDDGIIRIKALVLSKKKSLPHIAKIRKNWYFLISAIQTVYREGPHPRGSVHYLIYSEYLRRFSLQRQSDIVLAEINKL
jgi:hypothetical protein